MTKLINQITELEISEAENKSTDLNASGKEANKQIGDLGFSLIKNMINTGDEISGGDVSSYLQKADEINDDVDTVVFGLETDDESIVKVYVAVDDADEFEKAMAERLGTEDDIEDVIAELAQEFDIVDVEWPDGEDEEDDGEETEEPEVETQNSAGEESSEAEYELNFDEPEVKENMEEFMQSLGESFKTRVLGQTLTEAKIKDEDWPKELAGFAKTLTTPGQESILYLISLFGLPREVIGSKKAIGQFRKNIIAAGREYQKNQTLKLWINKLIKELGPKESDSEKEVELKAKMAEAVSEKEKTDLAVEWDDPKLKKAAAFRDSLPRGIARLTYDVLLALGIPAVMLTDINRTKVRETFREFTHLTKRNSRIRIYLNLIAEALGIKKDDQAETAAQTVKEEEIAEAAIYEPDYSALVREVLIELGVPADNIMYREANVIRSFKKRKQQLHFAAIARKLELFIDFIKKNERASVNEAVAELDFFALVNELSEVLGLPPENMKYRGQQVLQSIKKRKNQINFATIAPRLEKLIEFIRKNEIKQESQSLKDVIRSSMGLAVIQETAIAEAKKPAIEEIDDAETDKEVDAILNKEKRSSKKAKGPEAADVGKWNFASLGENGGLTMKAKGVTIKLPVESAEKVVTAFGDGKPATVKTSTGQRVIFSPRDRGVTYIVAGLDKFANGCKLSKEDVEKFIDTMAGK